MKLPCLLRDLKTARSLIEYLDLMEVTDPEDRAHEEGQLKLSWYFGGKNVAYKDTLDGALIVAAGSTAEVGSFFDALPVEEINQTVTTFPPRLKEVMGHLLHDPRFAPRRKGARS